jgi:hypothetical protein
MPNPLLNMTRGGGLAQTFACIQGRIPDRAFNSATPRTNDTVSMDLADDKMGSY